jgi:hypothetical protein
VEVAVSSSTSRSPGHNRIAVLYRTVIIIIRPLRSRRPSFCSSPVGLSDNLNTQMGAICSKPSSHTGGHTLVSVSSTAAQPRASASRPQQSSQPPQNAAEARRSQAAAAAEQRIKAVSPSFHDGRSRALDAATRLNKKIKKKCFV